MKPNVLFACLLVSALFSQTQTTFAEAPETHSADAQVVTATYNGLHLSSSEARFMQRVVVLTNQERARHNLSPLKLHSQLTQSACWMARDMGDHDYLAHTDRQGRTFDKRICQLGYTDFEALGENVAGGQATPESVFDGWMNSEHHRANILNPDFQEIGVGYVLSPTGRYHRYWVQDFGARSEGFPVVINNEEGCTESPNVSLYLYGAGSMKQMRLSNDGKTWTAWEKFRTTREWKLAPGQGRRIVYVQMKDSSHCNDKDVQTSEDDIELAPSAPVSAERTAQN